MNTPDADRQTKEGIIAFSKEFPFFKLIGLEVVDLEPGWSRTRLEHRPDLSQPAGILHGGVLASLIDTGIAHALLLTDRFKELRKEGGGVVTIDLRVKYFRPVSGSAVVCDSTITRSGRKIIHAESVVRNQEEKEVARGDAIYMWVEGDQIRDVEADQIEDVEE